MRAIAGEELSLRPLSVLNDFEGSWFGAAAVWAGGEPAEAEPEVVVPEVEAFAIAPQPTAAAPMAAAVTSLDRMLYAMSPWLVDRRDDHARRSSA